MQRSYVPKLVHHEPVQHGCDEEQGWLSVEQVVDVESQKHPVVPVHVTRLPLLSVV